MTATRVLVVEDQAIVAKDIERNLLELGYVVPAIALSGEGAIQRAAETQPDLVLMDIRLSGEMDGIEAAEEIRTRFDIPVVYLTGYADEETVRRAKLTEPFGYIVKPFESRELGSAIEVALYKHEMERRLRESEERYRSLFENVPVGINLTTPEGQILDANPALVEMLGFPDRETALAVSAADLYVDPEDRERWQALIERERVVRGFEVQLRRRDGTAIWVRSSARAVCDADGQVLSYEGSLEDITERKRAEEALREREEKYRTILENIEEGYYEVDIAGNFTFFNDSLCTLLGYSQDELMGMNNREYMDEENAKKVYQTFNAVYLTGEPARAFDWEVTRKDESRRFVEASVSLIRDPIGEPARFRGIVRDVTERKRAEEELQRTLEKLREALGGIIQTVALTVETKDPYTAGHQRRVGNLARAIATEMGLSEEQIEGIHMAGGIHDLGKVGVPTEILGRPGPLSDLQFGLIKMHSQIGYDVLKTIEFPWPVAQIVLQHHERLDGSGYPQGLSGEEILLEARILAVADVVEAMASRRPYRPPRGLDKALEEISQNRGVLYDPEAVDACLKLFTEKGFEFE